MTKKIRLSYKHLKALPTFEERFDYLKQNGVIGQDTFGFDRYLNQSFYQSPEWKKVRRQVILRDEGCDLGIDSYPLGKKGIVVHHLNPISEEDIENRNPAIFDMDNLICCSKLTHNAIHYSDKDILKGMEEVERKPNDQCPWKQ